MFCPICGKDNSRELRFCVTCGTNLETVSQALSGNKDDVFTRTDSAIDNLIARYAEHVFRNAPSLANNRSVGNSWKILGQGVVTTFVDLVLFCLMTNIYPIKFIILLISTPIRVLSNRSNRQRRMSAEIGDFATPSLPAAPERSLDSVPSIGEHTTEHLDDYVVRREKPMMEKGNS